MNKPYVFILHPAQKSLIEDLMAAPAPQGEAAITKAMLQNSRRMYVGELGRVDCDFIVNRPPGRFASYPANSMRLIKNWRKS